MRSWAILHNVLNNAKLGSFTLLRACPRRSMESLPSNSVKLTHNSLADQLRKDLEISEHKVRTDTFHPLIC